MVFSERSDSDNSDDYSPDMDEDNQNREHESNIDNRIESLRNHYGNGNCNAMLLFFQSFRLKRFIVFCLNLLPLRV